MTAITLNLTITILILLDIKSVQSCCPFEYNKIHILIMLYFMAVSLNNQFFYIAFI